ncbi:hypothetical protein AAFF_G00030120 [Aldrovandia affinis]|uniref:Uncharacterized protein n=1 Tax=Aldrovandia affinis TaxID=143900 RepID=A0AAD7R2D9_9TELE|nr:hypothetical protein AAFF_G00030120 [Aldrovandia affinis]
MAPSMILMSTEHADQVLQGSSAKPVIWLQVCVLIQNCVDNVTVDKQIRVYPNQKPWMSKEVRTLLKDRNTAFRSGDRALYSAARANLKRGIRDAKAAYKRKTEDHFTNNDPRRV